MTAAATDCGKDACNSENGRYVIPTMDVPENGQLARFPTGRSVHVSEITGTWHVAEVLWREDENLSNKLNSLGIPHYFPTVTRNRIVRGKRESVQSPLFPGYLSFAGDAEAKYAALMTHKVARVLPVVNQAKFRRELEFVEMAVAENPKLGLFRKIPAGSRCRITAGPLMGVEGFLESMNAKNRIVLRLAMLGGNSVVQDVDPEIVEIIE